MNYNNLKFRRQFIFSDQEILPFQEWDLKKISWNKKDYHLMYHPDLECTHHKANLTIYLLGYILDPFKPELSNSDIIESFSKEDNYNSVLKRTDFYNGRYVIIIFDGEEIIAFNDATASKQLYYFLKPESFFIASTPNLIKEFTDLKLHNNDELHDFLNSDKFRNKNTAWFGDETPFENVYNLFPNHYINLISKKTIRFWPRESLQTRNLKETVDYVSKILTGTMKSASNRYQLHSSLTGGWDSRIILSSSKQIKDSIDYYTFVDDTIQRKNIHDVIIPEKLSKRYNLTHEKIRIENKEIEEQFLEIFENNSVFNRNTYNQVYYKYIELGYEHYMNVTGTMGDQLLRVFYRFKGEITAQKFAEKFEVAEFPFIIKAIDKWLKEVEDLQEDSPINIIDWFNWEFYSPNWAGISATEHDIVRDELRVFNCRALITAIMQVKEKHRYRDNPKTHELIIKKNWKELLEFTVEPSGIQYRKLKKVLRFIGLEKSADMLYQNLKYWLKN